MVIDPWGRVLHELDGIEEGLIIADLDSGAIDDVRAKMPVIKHQRTDLYHDPGTVPVSVVDDHSS